MKAAPSSVLVHDLFLPTLLFAALGGMTWAVRGCTGFGGADGCIFAGVMWGAAWWFLAREPGLEPSRRYSSAWIVLAVTIGVGFSGARGWMQWPSFFEEKLQTNYGRGEFLPISRTYGFVWLFIAGMPWAGIGACLLAWCGSLRTTRAWHWTIRVACGVGGAALGYYLFTHFPQYFLPLYESLEDRYHDTDNNPNLRRLTNDCRWAIMHLGAYLGLLAYEVGRRDWKNALLIATVGTVNGTGWALCQNWKWAAGLWPGTNFNWWRCWESSGGISIGIAYGLAWFVVNRRMSDEERAIVRRRRSIAGPNLEWLAVWLGLAAVAYALTLGEFAPAHPLGRPAKGEHDPITWGLIYVVAIAAFGLLYYASHLFRGHAATTGTAAPADPYGDPNLERLGLYLGLVFGLGLSLRNGLRGWFNLYRGKEEHYSQLLWQIFGPSILVVLLLVFALVIIRPLPRGFRGDVFPHATAVMWLVILWQNAIAQFITGPLTQWNEVAFSIYYGLLFLITAVIVIHYSMIANTVIPEASFAGRATGA